MHLVNHVNFSCVGAANLAQGAGTRIISLHLNTLPPKIIRPRRQTFPAYPMTAFQKSNKTRHREKCSIPSRFMLTILSNSRPPSKFIAFSVLFVAPARRTQLGLLRMDSFISINLSRGMESNALPMPYAFLKRRPVLGLSSADIFRYLRT